MPRKAKGARLYLRRARADRSAQAVWVIRDGACEISTGCLEDRLGDAEQALAAHIASKHLPPQPRGGDQTDPASVLIADVLLTYKRERVPHLADQASNDLWISHLDDFWGESTCAEIKRSTCGAYVAWRTSTHRRGVKSERAKAKKVSEATARRELEVLSAAIGWWDQERPFTRRPSVILPPPPESQRDALSRHQAARLLMAARGYRWIPADGRWAFTSKTTRTNRRHLRRFILLGLYTGSRPGVYPQLLWRESPANPWLDVDDGVIYRRGRAERDKKTKRRPISRLPDNLLAHARRWKAADERAAARNKAEAPNTVLHFGSKPIRGRLRTSFESCVRDAGLPPEITPHWLRHTCATWLMEAGAEIWDAAGYAGMTVAVLERHYGHHRPSHNEGARRALRGARARQLRIVSGGVSGGG